MPIPPVAKLADVPPPDDVAKPPANAAATVSGVRSLVLTQGGGTDHPGPNDLFDVRYVAWTSTGKMVDQSPNHPMLLGVHQLFPGFAEGVELMVQGEKRRIWVPGYLAFGDHPKTGLPAGDVTVDATLVTLKKRGDVAAALPAPADVASPPRDATRTKSGLVYRVLTPGSGRTPTANDIVEVNYSGWTPNGRLFATNARAGRPQTVRLDHVLPGWSDGLTLMKEGETARLWVPASLAYGAHPSEEGVPAGPLVFDVQLVSVK